MSRCSRSQEHLKRTFCKDLQLYGYTEQFFDPLQVDLRLSFIQRRRIALVGRLQRHGHDGARVQIDRVLGLVRQVGAPVFHLRYPCVLVCRTLPLLVRRALLALPIEPRQILPDRASMPDALANPRKNSS